MNFRALVKSRKGDHQVTLTTGDRSHSIDIAPNASGVGSSANGGELLFLALATCYCNDIFREAAKSDIGVAEVQVEVAGALHAEGRVLADVTYRARVSAHASEAEILELIHHTDRVAEVHNTLRSPTPVRLAAAEGVSL